MPTGEASIPGAENSCVEAAQEGENCGGYDESTGLPFPDCDEDLVCVQTAEMAISGAEYTCRVMIHK